MTRTAACLGLAALLQGVIFSQSTKAPAFDVADVHVSAHSRNPVMQGGVLRGGRYELHNANMVDLIRTAYSVDAENVVGGPSWLESDRFDVIAKTPTSTSSETMKLMLQSLLADRFKLVIHNETRPMPAFVLAAGKGKTKMKEAVATANQGCQVQPPGPPQGGIPPYNVLNCHNVTMATFAPSLRTYANAYVTIPVVDSTGLKGSWDFDLKWTSQGLLRLAGADGISLFDAIDKQLGLKLDQQKVPMPVIVVDSANQKPTANPPGVTTNLPPPLPTEFEVATIRPADLSLPPAGAGLRPNGQVEFRRLPLGLLIKIAWDLHPEDPLFGAPKWLNMNGPVFDLVAKVSTSDTPGNAQQLTNEQLQPMLRALLVDRFKMKTHYEDRPVDAYTLVAAKPKLKKADLSNRTGCKTGPAPVTRDPGDFTPPPFVATCQNITMAEFADRLQSIGLVYFHYPVLDATGIEGSWDFSLTYSLVPPGLAGGGGGRGGAQTKGNPAPAAVRGADGVASDPVGGISLLDAVEKQLGLKLELHKRPLPVLVIDHIEEMPTEN